MVRDHAYGIKNTWLEVQLGSHCLHFRNFTFEYQILRVLWCSLELQKVSWQKIWKDSLCKYH